MAVSVSSTTGTYTLYTYFDTNGIYYKAYAFTGSGSINGYNNLGTTYSVVSTNGTNTFQLGTELSSSGYNTITTTAGTTTGITFYLGFRISQRIRLKITGTNSGTGTILGYSSGNVYKIKDSSVSTITNGVQTFSLTENTVSGNTSGTDITTTSGTLTGLSVSKAGDSLGTATEKDFVILNVTKTF